MDLCCLEECGEYSVRPMLVATKHDGCPREYPCLPRCTKQTIYCCKSDGEKCCREPPKCYKTCTVLPTRPGKCKDTYVCVPPPRPPSCEPECRPVKTKYIMPCYRYEDGRICNQPSKLMRRACEVAVGNRPRKKHCEPCPKPDAEHSESCCIYKEDDKEDCCYFDKDCVPCYKVGRYSSSPVFCVEYPPRKPRCCHDSYFS